MAPFKFGKKKQTDSASASPQSQNIVNSSQVPASPRTSSGSNHTFTNFNATRYNTTSSPGAYNTSTTSSNIAPQQQYQQSPAVLGYDHNNNIYNPRSPQRTPGNQSYASNQYPYGSPQRQPQFTSSPQQQLQKQQVQPSSPWSRSKLLISPFPRYRHAASTQANEKGEIFVMGGLHNTSVYGDTWIIKQDEQDNFKTFQVDIYENSPAPRVGHASTLCGNAYVIFGGDTVTNDAGEIDNDLYLFNMNSHTWTIPNPIGQKPPGRYGHSIGVIAITNFDSKLYLYGGQLDDVIYNDLVVFNLSSFRRPDVQWELVTPEDSIQPPPLSNHSMDVYDNKLWIFGGSTGSSLSNDLWCYDPLVNKWEKIVTTGSVPPPLEEHASVIYKDLLIVHGGKTNSSDASSNCYFLNLVTKVWFKFPTGLTLEPQGKYGHSISILKNDKLLILGGHLPDYANLGDDLEPSTEDNGVGTLLNVLDLSVISKFIPGLYQYGTPTRNSDQAKFANYETLKDSRQQNIFTPPTQSQSSPIKERSFSKNSQEQNDKAITANYTIDRSSSSASNNAYQTKNIITAEDVFQQKYSNSNSPIDQPSSPKTLQKDFEATTPTHNKTQSDQSNVFSSPEEELPLEIPPPFDSHSRDVSTSIELEKSNEGVSYINSGTRVSEFFDSYVNNDSSVNLDENEEAFIDATSSADLKQTEEVPISKSVETPSVPQVSNSKDTGKEIDLVAASAAGAITAAALNKAFKGNNDNVSNKEIATPVSKEVPIVNEVPVSKAIPVVSNTKDDEKEEFMSIIKSLSSEIEALKLQTNEQAKIASEKVKQLESENEELKSRIPEKEEPKEIEEDENDIKRKYIKLNADYSILNQGHESLKSRFNEIEPIFSSNLIDLQKLNEIIKSQESELSETKIQLKEEESWKFKFEELKLRFEKLESENNELLQSRDLSNSEQEPLTETAKLTSVLDSFISKYAVKDEETNEIKSRGLDSAITNRGDVVESLRTQIDDLLKENEQSQNQNKSLNQEIEELKTQTAEVESLRSRLAELSKIEENYKESLYSVRNTSKALQVSQTELSKQKETINSLKQEIDELKIFSVRKTSRNTTPQINDYKNNKGDDLSDDSKEVEDFENEHYNLKIRDLQAELFITKQDNEDLKQEILTLKKKLLVVNTPTSSL